MRLIPILTVIAGVSAALGAQAPSPQALPDPVRVEQGLVSGTGGRSAAVRVYRGVPYAAAPSGDLRWKPPQPAPAWEGVRQANAPGNACPQPPYPTNGIYGASPPPTGEDCLNLNIWTPAKTAGDRLPGMGWLERGGS